MEQIVWASGAKEDGTASGTGGPGRMQLLPQWQQQGREEEGEILQPLSSSPITVGPTYWLSSVGNQRARGSGRLINATGVSLLGLRSQQSRNEEWI